MRGEPMGWPPTSMLDARYFRNVNVQQKLCSRVVTLVTTKQGTTLSVYNASWEKLSSAWAFAWTAKAHAEELFADVGAQRRSASPSSTPHQSHCKPPFSKPQNSLFTLKRLRSLSPQRVRFCFGC